MITWMINIFIISKYYSDLVDNLNQFNALDDDLFAVVDAFDNNLDPV